MDLVAVPVPATQHALADEAELQQGSLRARVVQIGVGTEPFQSQPLEGQPCDQRLGGWVRSAAPVRAPQPGSHHGAAIPRG